MRTYDLSISILIVFEHPSFPLSNHFQPGEISPAGVVSQGECELLKAQEHPFIMCLGSFYSMGPADLYMDGVSLLFVFVLFTLSILFWTFFNDFVFKNDSHTCLSMISRVFWYSAAIMFTDQICSFYFIRSLHAISGTSSHCKIYLVHFKFQPDELDQIKLHSPAVLRRLVQTFETNKSVARCGFYREPLLFRTMPRPAMCTFVGVNLAFYKRPGFDFVCFFFFSSEMFEYKQRMSTCQSMYGIVTNQMTHFCR